MKICFFLEMGFKGYMKNRFSRCLSVFLVVSFLLINTYSVSVKAAGPVISFQNDTEQTLVADSLQSVSGLTGKIRVSNLRLANLEEPKAGSVLDSRATVICDGGLFWEIPVVWVDENGSYSLICLPGKSYKPVLAFYIPKNVQVMNDPGSNSFSLKLPDFLNGIIDSNNLLMVKSDAYGITFIASADLANSSVGNNLAQTADTNRLFSAIVSNGQIDNFFKEKNRDKINNFVDFTAEQNAALAAEAARNSENNNTTQEASSSSENASSGTSSDTPSEPETPSSDVTITEDLIKLYCTKASIDEYGEDNLNKILNLIINPESVKFKII